MASKYTRSARGQECQVRLIGICNHNPETVVFAHLNGAGMGIKHADIHGAFCCSACHDQLDGRANNLIDKDQLKLEFLEGVIRTQQIMIKEGILKL